jgi:hypothetical protein
MLVDHATLTLSAHAADLQMSDASPWLALSIPEDERYAPAATTKIAE